MWTLIPLPYRIIAIAAVLAILVGIGARGGYVAARDVKDAEIAKLNAGFQDRIETAQKALDAANEHTATIEHQASTDLAVADIKHTKELSDANAKSQVTIAAFRAGTVSLRYNVTPDAGGGGKLPGAPSPACGSDGGTVARLPDEIAGNLSALAADADQVVLQLHLAQDTIRAYQTAAGPVTQQ